MTEVQEEQAKTKQNYHIWTDLKLVTLKNAIVEFGRKWKQIQQVYFNHIPVNDVRRKGYSLDYVRNSDRPESVINSQTLSVAKINSTNIFDVLQNLLNDLL
ncbi:Conserved_hypothetical protein [Hexamita inflata]|uniref:Uncharacterized protein n=1 Tax=Hexamita inflata TaxID=28002 RepID=A0AA86USH3_9EUKA|nr:Conserved hypothetical protein [Hexamita inflata]